MVWCVCVSLFFYRAVLYASLLTYRTTNEKLICSFKCVKHVCVKLHRRYPMEIMFVNVLSDASFIVLQCFSCLDVKSLLIHDSGQNEIFVTS